MIDNMMFYVNGKERSLSKCTDLEIESLMDDYHFYDLVGFIKYQARIIREQNHIIQGLEHLLHEDMNKEDFEK